MDMKTLDMRGKPCPMPVIEAKKALAVGDDATVLVDNAAAVQNLKKMADGMGYAFAEKAESGGQFSVIISAGGGAAPAVERPQPTAQIEDDAGLVILITSDEMGRGSGELGRMLMKGFVFSLTELAAPPKTVIFLNGGAKLTTAGANTVDDLQTLMGKGTTILTCGTCLNYYELTEKLAVGEVTDMMRISQTLAEAARVVTL